MINILLMGLCCITLTLQSVFKKKFQLKCAKGEYTFSTILSATAFAVFLILARGEAFSAQIFPYSVLFAAAYAAATVTEVVAIGCGSLALTSLIVSYSLTIPTLCGIFLWKEPIGVWQYIGIAALLISLYLIKGDSTGEEKRPSVKWVVYTAVAFLTNGLCSVIQRQQQIAFNSTCDNTFMAVALAIATATLGIVSFVKERQYMKAVLKYGSIPAILCGASNAATNWLVMLCLLTIPASIFFPVLAAGKLVAVFLLSVCLYKEAFSKKQKVGFLFGIAALAFMNL